MRTKTAITSFSALLAAALLTTACSESAGPARSEAVAPRKALTSRSSGHPRLPALPALLLGSPSISRTARWVRLAR